jgi:hypothetical protein
MIVDALKSTAALRATYVPRSSSLADLERAFAPLADAGRWNRAHPESPITTFDLGAPLCQR